MVTLLSEEFTSIANNLPSTKSTISLSIVEEVIYNFNTDYRSMGEESSQASETIWIDREEYYFVCSDCYRNWGLGRAWQDNVVPWADIRIDDWKEIRPILNHKMAEQSIDCELCDYDVSDLFWRLRRGDLTFDEIPDIAKGDVFLFW